MVIINAQNDCPEIGHFLSDPRFNDHGLSLIQDFQNTIVNQPTLFSWHLHHATLPAATHAQMTVMYQLGH